MTARQDLRLGVSCCKWKTARFIIEEATLTMRRDFIESSCMVADMALGCATRAITRECCEEMHSTPRKQDVSGNGGFSCSRLLDAISEGPEQGLGCCGHL